MDKKAFDLVLSKNVKTLQLTFYEEQLKTNLDDLLSKIKNTKIDEAEVILIEHSMNKDIKRHYHMGIRLAGKNAKNGKHIGTLLNYYGIEYRLVEDKNLINNTLTPIGNYQEFLKYLLHSTAKAKAEGKEQYEITDIVSNMSTERIQMYIDGYEKKGNSVDIILEELDKLAYEYGYQLMDFDELIEKQSFKIRANPKRKAIKESYERGVAARIEEDDTVARTCIFIEGEKDIGKTYGSNAALQKMGYNKILKPAGGKTVDYSQ